MGKTRIKILVALFLLASLSFYYLASQVVRDLKPRYRESVEESLVDSATLLSTYLSLETERIGFDGGVAEFSNLFAESASLPLDARVYEFVKREMDLKVYVTDHKGIVVFHSDRALIGADFSEWNDVARTIRGQYGARTTRDNPNDPNSSVLYVAAPIKRGGQIVGVLSLGKPSHSIYFFLNSARSKIVSLTLAAALLSIIPCILLSLWLSRPIEDLTRYVRAVRDGKRMPLPRLGSTEARALGEAFEEMRERLEGRRYVERYVQTLTHELKAPLSAIRGAAELLEDVSEEHRKRLISNIQDESKRIREVIDRLLELSALEGRKALSDVEEIVIGELLEEVVASARASAPHLHFTLRCDDPLISTHGERFLLFQALRNLLGNAIEFSKEGGVVEVRAESFATRLMISVVDQGSGIPPYALSRIFDHFYSLPRPSSGRKSSGLGLAFVREVADLHGGEVSVRNRDDTFGVVATLCLPCRGSR